MGTTNHTGTPLRKCMTDEMRLRELEDKTQQADIHAVRKLTVYCNRLPDTATVQGLRNVQLHLMDSGTSPITLNATLSGLRFFFDIRRGQVELMARMQPVTLPRTAPFVLSAQEATHLLGRKVDICVIQVLLRHKKLETTPIGARVATDLQSEVFGPLAPLPPS